MLQEQASDVLVDRVRWVVDELLWLHRC
jgi:hypothetical protein